MVLDGPINADCVRNLCATDSRARVAARRHRRDGQPLEPGLIGKLVDLFQPTECANYFSSCGYDPELAEIALICISPGKPVLIGQFTLPG